MNKKYHQSKIQKHAVVNKWNTTSTSNEIHVSKTNLTGFLSIRLNVGSQKLQRSPENK